MLLTNQILRNEKKPVELGFMLSLWGVCWYLHIYKIHKIKFISYNSKLVILMLKMQVK